MLKEKNKGCFTAQDRDDAGKVNVEAVVGDLAARSKIDEGFQDKDVWYGCLEENNGKEQGWMNRINYEDLLVRKEFRRFRPAVTLFFFNFFYKMLKGDVHFYFPTTEKRIENEIQTRKLLEDKGDFLPAPAVTSREGKNVWMEYIRGENGRKFLAKTQDLQEVYEIAKLAGSEKKKLADLGACILDSRFEDLIIPEGKLNGHEIYATDFELFVEDATPQDIKISEGILRASLKILPPEKYEEALRGLRDGYGKDLYNGLPVYVYLSFEVIREAMHGNVQNIRHIFRNNWNDLKSGAKRRVSRLVS